MTQLMIGKIFLIIVGSFLLILFIYLTGKTILFLKNSEKAKGRIIELVRSDNGKGKHTPVVKFKVPSGEKVSFRTSSSSTSYYEGQEVTVLYDAKFPEDAKIKSFFELWFAPVMLLIFGALILFGGIFAGQGALFGDKIATQPQPEPVESMGKLQYFLLYWVLPGGFILFGSFFILSGLSEIKKRVSCSYWPSAEGVVMESEVGEPYEKFILQGQI